MRTLNVIDTALRTGIFQTFTRLMEGSQLERSLRSNQPYTLFAPVDIAFAYLQPETLNHLLKLENQGTLSNLLEYHVVPRIVMSHELRVLERMPTVFGLELLIQNGTDICVGGAKVLHVDLEAYNGVIHGIDRLLMPKRLAAKTTC